MKKNYLQIALLIILVASIVFYHTRAGEDYLPYMQEMAGTHSEITFISGQVYEASQDGQVIGYFDRQSAIGYAGPIEVLVFVGVDGLVKDLRVVKQIETPSFFQKVISKGFVDDLLEKEANSPFELGVDLDAVTNATYTSRAIAEAVRKASHNIAVTKLNMQVPKTAGFKLPLEDYLILALLLAVFILQKLKQSKLRYLTLLVGFLLIGYWQKSLLSLANISSVLAGNIPWQSLPFWLVLLVGVLFLILITGRNLYCYWMCPFGALSELLGAFGKFGRMNYKPCERSVQRFKNLRLILAWAALVFAFILNNPSISSYEIFAPLFAWEGAPVQWLLLPIMLFAGVFVLRFWCRFFCPVGGILDLLVKWRRSCSECLKSRVKRDKSKELKQLPMVSSQAEQSPQQQA
ncbi:MAG TPA: FMN-binding protein [Peptococcaceae bacterium]|nr:FMN-binding protein [Peptococcaceae bacterium]